MPASAALSRAKVEISGMEWMCCRLIISNGMDSVGCVQLHSLKHQTKVSKHVAKPSKLWAQCVIFRDSSCWRLQNATLILVLVPSVPHAPRDRHGSVTDTHTNVFSHILQTSGQLLPQQLGCTSRSVNSSNSLPTFVFCDLELTRIKRVPAHLEDNSPLLVLAPMLAVSPPQAGEMSAPPLALLLLRTLRGFACALLAHQSALSFGSVELTNVSGTAWRCVCSSLAR
jgi:hypothetical protein